MPIYINGKSLDEIFKENDIKISEIDNVIDMKVNVNNVSLFEKDYKTTLSNIGIEYSDKENIDDWIRDLLKFD